MNDAGILFGLLIVSIALGIVLAFLSMAAVGRTASDLDRQAERGITGIPNIQAWVNLRNQLNRVAFGITFAIINIMLIAGAPEGWRMWINRSLWTLLLLSFVVMVVLDWRDERKQVRLGMREMLAARVVRENELLARTPVAVTKPAPMDSVDVATIQPEAVVDIAQAVKDVVTQPGSAPTTTE